MHDIGVSATFARQFKRLPAATQRRVLHGLSALAEDPRRTRPRADIKALAGTDPPKHRLRVGDHRIVYAVQGNQVLVLELFARGRGYRLD